MRIICAALNCKYSSEHVDSSNVIFINFPNDDTAKIWAECCGRSDLATKSNAELHLNYYICSHHIEDRYYISKTVPIIIEEGTVPTLFGTNLNTSSESISIFHKSQHLQEVGDNVPLTYCDMNVEIDEYRDITIRLSNLCRICGESVLEGVDIFAAKGIELKLREKINLHMPVSIDVEDSMPQKVCLDCCNKLEITHSLVTVCLRTDIRLRRFLNTDKESEYESKYNALVDECSLEIAQEICMDDNIQPECASFTMYKMLNSKIKTCSRGIESGECSETQSNNFENVTKNIMSSQLNTLIETCRGVDNRNNQTVAKEIFQIQQDKILNGSQSILCLQCQTVYDTQEVFENHKIICRKNENVTQYIIASKIAEARKYKNEHFSLENSQICNKGFKNNQAINKSGVCESLHCTICNQIFKCQQDYNNHKCLRENHTSKRCGHCKEIYHNRKNLLHHIVESHKGQLLFKCSMCDKTYEKWSSLDIHEATHRIDKPYLCDLCGKSFKHSNNLRGHKRIHLDESVKKRHVCKVCGNAFRSRFHLQEHMNLHDGNRPYSCEQCGKAFYKRIQLRQHKLSHGFNRHMCPICGTTFNRRGNMNAHMKRHSNGDREYTCSVCAHKCKSMSELKIHRKNHTAVEIVDSIKKKCNDKNIWQCDVCDKMFAKRTLLINHERIHGKNKLCMECDECGKKLASKSSLLYHKKSMHLKEKPHMCHYCGESFVSREARLIHERIHTGERPYVCKVCNTRYRCSSNLSQHMKIHTGLKPHKCHYCNKCFTRKGALTVHERIHTGIKPYACETCGRSFSQKNDMLKHAKTHNSKLMQCGHCNEVFKRKKDMLKHTTVHEQETSVIPDYVDSPPHILQAYVDTTDFGD